jgi:hypothetical protein
MEGGALEAGQLRFVMLLEAAHRDTWHRGSQEVAGPPREASSYLLVNTLGVALGKGLGAEASLPVAWMEAKDEAGEDSRSGVGDLLTRVMWSHAAGNWSYGLAAGAYWPVGELGSQDLPAAATFSTGTVDPSFSASLSGLPIGGFAWRFSASTRLVVDERDDGSRLGSSLTGAFALDRRLHSRVGGRLILTYLTRESDEGNAMEDSGGEWLYLQPFLTTDAFLRPSYAIQVVLGARFPLVQDVHGTQLVESPSFTLGFAQTFNL